MPVVAVLSMKGGVGKSTVALGLASAAWDRSLRTLVIDLDPQANASMALDVMDAVFTTSDVLADARIQTVEMSTVTAFTTFTGLKAAPQVRLNRDPSAARPRLQGLRVLDRFFLRQLS